MEVAMAGHSYSRENQGGNVELKLGNGPDLAAQLVGVSSYTLKRL